MYILDLGHFNTPIFVCLVRCLQSTVNPCAARFARGRLAMQLLPSDWQLRFKFYIDKILCNFLNAKMYEGWWSKLWPTGQPTGSQPPTHCN